MDNQRQPEIPKFITPEEASVRWLKSLEQRDGRRFFRSGFKTHDLTVGAFLRGGLYLIASRPGIGKTALLFSLAYRQERAGAKAFYSNLEMSVEQMWSRLACIHDRDLTLRELNEGELTEERARYLARLAEELVNFSPLFFESTDFTALIKAAKGNIAASSESVLFVDYVGLLTIKGLGPQERYWLVSECAKGLKLLARDLNIPVVAAVQLNRAIENRQDKRPTLADLRDSGELENHADAVFALTREDRELLEVNCLKNRHGPLGAYSLRFDGPRAAVEERE